MDIALRKYGPRIKSKRIRWVLCFLHLAWVALLYGPDEGVSQSGCENVALYYYGLLWPIERWSWLQIRPTDFYLCSGTYPVDEMREV
jgi:hypothetical protein